jgi:hypothetical protein
LDIVLKGNKEKVVNSVNIKHQQPGRRNTKPNGINARSLVAIF